MAHALLFPGQGAQYVGMGRTFYDAFSESALLFDQADDLLHMHLSRTIFNGPESLLTQTKMAQPAIFVTSLAILAALRAQFNLADPVCVAGLSLGEYTALTTAGVFSFEDGLRLVSKRAQYMHEACEKNEGTMLAIIGVPDDLVLEVVRGIALPDQLCCANFNMPGQVVISGTRGAIALAEQALKQRGAKRTIPLQVHGAFHSPLMREAAESLSTELKMTTFGQPRCGVAMNTTGTIANPSQYAELLARQVTSSVLWHQCVASCAREGIQRFIEVGCGKTLSTMNRRMNLSIPTISIDTIDDLRFFV